jgi:hypothetical protein
VGTVKQRVISKVLCYASHMEGEKGDWGNWGTEFFCELKKGHSGEHQYTLKWDDGE